MGVSAGSAWAAVPRGSTIAAAIAATVVLVSRPLVSRGRRSWPGGLFGFMVNALLRTRRSEEHTSELQSRGHLVCRLLLEKKKRSGELAGGGRAAGGPAAGGACNPAGRRADGGAGGGVAGRGRRRGAAVVLVSDA